MSWLTLTPQWTAHYYLWELAATPTMTIAQEEQSVNWRRMQ